MDSLYKRFRNDFILTVLCFVFSSLSVSLIPLLSGMPEDRQPILSNLIALVFWLSFIEGIAFSLWTNHTMLRILENKKIDPQRFPGILNFTWDIPHIILYIVILLGIIAIVTDIGFHYISEYLMFPIFSVTFLAVILHCIVDGRNYKTYKRMKEGINNEDKQ